MGTGSFRLAKMHFSVLANESGRITSVFLDVKHKNVRSERDEVFTLAG